MCVGVFAGAGLAPDSPSIAGAVANGAFGPGRCADCDHTTRPINTFAVRTNGNVGGTSNLTVEVTWGATGQATLSIGADCDAPKLLTVGTEGLLVGFTSGFVKGGEPFVIHAKPNANAFSRLNPSTNTPQPAIVLAYNSPRGNHRVASSFSATLEPRFPWVASTR